MNFLTPVFLLLVVAGGATTQTLAQPNPPVMPGSFRTVAVSGPDVLIAAKAAIGLHRAQSKSVFQLVSIERAEQQVVAGMNYRMTLKLKHGAKSERVTTQVYKNLQGKFALTSWMEIK